MRRVIGVLRAHEYSPNAVERDEAIMRAVVEPLHGQLVSEDDVASLVPEVVSLDAQSLPVVFSMARRPETLRLLSQLEDRGVGIINSPAGVRNCCKSVVERIMHEHHLPCPPAIGQHGYWLKRGDMAVTADGGLLYCRNDEELAEGKARFAERGITDVVIQAHVNGDVVKFYGVLTMGFFRAYHVDDKGRHYCYDHKALQANVELLSRLTGASIYGGDAVITADGDHYIIDFNDWPSFGRCREEAAEAISRVAFPHLSPIMKKR